jgi:fibronectin-binding autotransporter adhesin
VGLSTLAAATGTTTTYTGLLSGPGGALTIGDAANKGTVVFTENNTYNGGTTIFNGVTLQLGNGGTTGSIVGNIPDAGTVAFDRSDPITFAGTISGLGTLSQIGSGTLTLTASNLYRGGTFISGNGTVSVATNANLGITTGVIAESRCRVANC